VALTPGTRVGPYEILSRIGAGGMGEIYRAHDPRLRRELAVKVLPAASAGDPDRLRRLEREARSASSLNHPNIITIYDVGTDGGRAFIAMELVRGVTLAERLRQGPLLETGIVDLATQIGRGLGRAHRSGILHRDLKPDNIMVDGDGLVKIVDFGLALLKTDGGVGANSVTMTSDNQVADDGLAGTIPYMSPEQVLGKPLDARSDIFSLGVVLYEMATGRRPFRGATIGELFDEIVHREPDWTAVPDRLAPWIRRCLAKDVEARYPTMDVFLADLADVLPAPAAMSPQQASIAVMPFKNLSADADAEFLADGVTEDVILDLAKVARLRVISRASAMRLKATDKDLRTVGKELNVRYVLEGSIRKAAGRIRITTQVVDIARDAHVWGDRFQGAADDLFAIQEDMARRIVTALELTLTPDEDRRLRDRPIADVRAHECYVRARQELWRFTAEGLERARRLIQNGLDIVGDNELLFAAMGTIHWQFVNGGIDPSPDHIRRAAEFCEKALAAGGRSVQTHMLRAFLRMADGDIQASLDQLNAALAVDANDPDALYWSVLLLLFAGHGAAAGPRLARLLAVDPLSPQNAPLPDFSAFMDGDLSRGVRAGRVWHERDPDNPIARWVHGSSLARSRQFDEARTVFAELEARPDAGAFSRMAAMFLRALAGDREGTFAAVTPDLVEAARVDWQYSWEVASGYALVGASDQALDWLENAVTRGFINYRFLSLHDPLLADLRGDERFQALMADARKQQERLRV
jgi:TolB-like protein